MKKWIHAPLAVLLVVAFLLLSGCGGGSSNAQIVGRWEITQVVEKEKSDSIMGQIRSANYERIFPQGSVVEFMSNGLVHANGSSTKYDFPEEGKLRMRANGQGADTMVGLRLDGATMAWDFGPVIVEFRKQ